MLPPPLLPVNRIDLLSSHPIPLSPVCLPVRADRHPDNLSITMTNSACCFLQLTSKRTSKRYSTYSTSPSFMTTSTTYSNPVTLPSAAEATEIATATAARANPETEIRQLTQGFDRLENKHLSQQRFIPSQKKTDDLSKLSLGAKVERALGRRMTDQDAVFRVKVKRPTVKTSSSFAVLDEKAVLKF
ncbi:uncharacterized protein HMPREF1120_07373 [Exophiala dermatitidis NIH/UT8656]|uniref:Uncharacterized protein n=1 Tax=Exophiala dermatitidis (strain ATCC 34100 / CBS 525.76 / NIH/UT8656) TaxID=858893 RepID=H6C6N7_EXODN|nr:uncharacterized protein HMPREF1120_07373 [Exophiala dermatitidis NIH/UT8656]EHY59383.1 hypothetical protein HMPREF1120_07373 [Exophiala dermatitidis NIH/UT8656]